MKKIKYFVLVLILLCFTLTILPKESIADFGDFESYDSGYDSDWGSSSYDSDWGSSSYDSDWRSSSYDDGYYSSGSSESGSFFVVITFVIIIILFLSARGSASSRNRNMTSVPHNVERSAYRRDENRSRAVAAQVIAVDKQFNEETFISNAKNLFIKLQNAWADRDLETLRPLVSVELFDQYSKNIQSYIQNKKINKLERISTNYGELVSFQQDNEKDTLVVAINSSMVDYIVDEVSGNILKGDNSSKITNTYKMTFTRKKGVLTEEGTSSVKTTNCPNCGAPTRITSSGRCEYCDSVITTGNHDWVLAGIERY